MVLKVLATITLISSSIGIISLFGSGVASATPAMPPTMSSWYVEDVNTSTAYNTGCVHAQFANSVGTGGTVILDFGGQVNSSTLGRSTAYRCRTVKFSQWWWPTPTGTTTVQTER